MALFDSERISRVVRANVNDLLAKAKDPLKVLEQFIRDEQRELTQLHRLADQAIANWQQTEQQYYEIQEKANKCQQIAQLSLQKGDENLAWEALTCKKAYANKAATLKAQLAEQTAQIQQLKHALIALESKVSEAKAKKDVFKQKPKHFPQQQDYQPLKALTGFWETTVGVGGVIATTTVQATQTVEQIYEQRRTAVAEELAKIGFKDWCSFVSKSQTELDTNVIKSQDWLYRKILNPFAPYEALLTDEDIEKIRAYEAQYQWDKWDYAFVGASGVLASLTDYLLVSIPRTINIGEYAGQVGSPLTAWLKDYNINKSDDWFAQWARHLEEICKVPYDATNIPGMSPSSHRFQTFGHDPVLGFIFGVLDIMRGTITGFSYDKLSGMHSPFSEVSWSNNSQIGLIEAILRQIGHLISDAFTPMGLPAPFMTLIQGINIGRIGEEGRTVGEVARWMYLNGYDFRHFLVSGITPAVIEIVLRTYIMLRHYSEHGETKFMLGSHPKYRSMLLAAHSIAALGNVGKIVLMNGNPLAINEAQWLALVRYLIPSIKYWVFDQHRLRLEYLKQMKDSEWDMVLRNSDKILETMAEKTDCPVVALG